MIIVSQKYLYIEYSSFFNIFCDYFVIKYESKQNMSRKMCSFDILCIFYSFCYKVL